MKMKKYMWVVALVVLVAFLAGIIVGGTKAPTPAQAAEDLPYKTYVALAMKGAGQVAGEGLAISLDGEWIALVDAVGGLKIVRVADGYPLLFHRAAPTAFGWAGHQLIIYEPQSVWTFDADTEELRCLWGPECPRPPTPTPPIQSP